MDEERMTDDEALSPDGRLSDPAAGAGPGPAVEPPATARRAARTVAIGLGVVIALLVGAALLTGEQDPEMPDNVAELLDPDASPDATDPAGSLALSDAAATLPPFELMEFGGDAPVEITRFLGGDPLVLNFWATWCAPCVAEMPDFQLVHEAGADSFRLIGVNTMDAAINAEPFVEELGITYDLAVDPNGEFFQLTGGFGMPTTLFVQPDGTVAYRHTGPLTIEQMTMLLDEHLGVQVEL